MYKMEASILQNAAIIFKSLVLSMREEAWLKGSDGHGHAIRIWVGGKRID